MDAESSIRAGHDPCTPAPCLTIVVPLRDEESNAAPLVNAVREALQGVEAWELLLVDDGSEDRTRAIVAELARRDPRVRLIPLARNYGQSAAMQAGFDQARGDIVLTMDGDLQNDARDIPRLVSKLAEGFDLVSGYRVSRQDAWLTRRAPSWVANRIIRWTTGVHVRDIGCTLRAYRRDLIERVHLYSDLHRFMPALAVATTGARIAEIPVRHHPRRLGRSKYGLSRVPKVPLDLLTLKMIRSFRERPLLLFAIGSLGAALCSAVFLLAAAVAPSNDPTAGLRVRLSSVCGRWDRFRF